MGLSGVAGRLAAAEAVPGFDHRAEQLRVRLAPGFGAGGGGLLDELAGYLFEGGGQAPQMQSDEAKILFGTLRRFLDPPELTEDPRHRT